MKTRISNHILLFIIIILLAGLSGCRKDKNDSEGKSSIDDANIFLYNTMKSWYLWNQEVPDVDPSKYASPSALLDALVYKQLDRWSFVGEKREIESLFEGGEFYGFGFYFAWDTSDSLRIALVYKDSEAYREGIRRSNKVLKINDTDIDQITDISSFIANNDILQLEIVDTAGVTRDVEITKDVVTINPVMEKDIFEVNGKKAGYIVYDSFLEFSELDVIDAFTYFKENNIDELILDLRYNGGGSNALMETIADILIKPEDVGKIFYTMHHNNDRSQAEDFDIFFRENELNLGLDRIFVITTSSSASASEALINGLTPYMDVIQIGSTTHGKPVGMYQFNFGMWSMLPVSFKNVNADGYGEYFDGLAPDYAVVDDVTRRFGDPDELCLSEALYYIRNSEFSALSVSGPKSYKPGFALDGIYGIINSF